jgi:hypothetical protein
MPAPPVEMARFLSPEEVAVVNDKSKVVENKVEYKIEDKKVEIFIHCSSKIFTVCVPLSMKIKNFIAVLVSVTGICEEQLKNFRVTWGGVSMYRNAGNLTLAGFGLSDSSTVHVYGVLSGCYIYEHHAKMRDWDSLSRVCFRELEITYVMQALDRYLQNYSHVEDNKDLRMLLINYCWNNFISYD